MNPAPNPYHQQLSGRIHFQLYSQIDVFSRGTVIYAPCDVQLSDHDIVQPDLLVVLRSRQSIITDTRIIGAPDLLIEILSESTTRYDRLLKKDIYFRSQIREYWIVDPKARVVEQFARGDAEYALIGSHPERIQLVVLPDVGVDLTQVW